jgi:hypothetical protein
MKKIFVSLPLFLLVVNFSWAQDVRLLGGGGISFHGTGDLKGYGFINQVDINYQKRFFVSPGLMFTNHSGEYRLTNFKLNYVTAGVNIFTNINYQFLKKPKHSIVLGAGPMIRFQNSAVPKMVGSSLGANGQQILQIEYDKLRTVALGYNITPAYYYACNSKLYLAAKAIFQNDTEGDVLTSGIFLIGVKL